MSISVPIPPPMSTPQPGPRVIPATIGLTLHVVWAAVLFGICVFDDGHYSESRLVECLLWCSIVVIPAVMAGFGMFKQNRKALVAAAWICVPILFISLAGAGMPLVIPAIAYGMAAAKQRPPEAWLKFLLVRCAVIGVLVGIGIVTPTAYMPLLIAYSLLMNLLAVAIWLGARAIQIVVSTPWLWISLSALTVAVIAWVVSRKRS